MRALLIVLLLALPGAAAVALPPLSGAEAMGPEQEILDGYLRQFDRAEGLPYCARFSPTVEATEDAPADVPPPNGTNTLMDDHMAWHFRHSRLRESAVPEDDNNTYGDDFLLMHRMTIKAYDAWRVEHGHAEVAVWDPATPIPPEFAYALPEACMRRDSENPAVDLPTWLTLDGGADVSPIFGARKLCDLSSMNRLGKELDEGAQHGFLDPTGWSPEQTIDPPPGSYHARVHGGVGGDMSQPIGSMRDPVFWAWHKWLDSRAQLWERECAHREPLDPAAHVDGMTHGFPIAPAAAPGPAPAETSQRAVPAAGALIAACALGAVALPRRRR